MAEIRKTTEIDRSFTGALKEIYRLCDRVKQLESDNKFLSEILLQKSEYIMVLKAKLEDAERQIREYSSV